MTPAADPAALAALAHLARVPLEPDRATARSWVVRELARREYQEARPGLVERALDWLWDRLNLLDLGTGAPPVPALVAIAAVVAAVVAYAVYRAGGLRGSARRRPAVVHTAASTTAQDHRVRADAHARAGDWPAAVADRFRAVARELEEAAVIGPRPGRTAREVALDGARELPDLRADLLAGAGAFEAVWYGRVRVGAEADAALRALDDRVRAAVGTAARR